MDGFLAIEHNHDALRRIVVALVAVAGMGNGATLPRHLHRAILRLLRPAESAARRLIIALARGIVIKLPSARQVNYPSRSMSVGQPGQQATEPVQLPSASGLPALRPPVLSLLDPLRLASPHRWIKQVAMPRISFPGVIDRAVLVERACPSPDDPLNATRLSRRLQALAGALNNMPRHALRFARWQARRKARPDDDAKRRRWPLRPGRPPGWRRSASHEVFAVLRHAHELAFWALEHPNSS